MKRAALPALALVACARFGAETPAADDAGDAGTIDADAAGELRDAAADEAPVDAARCATEPDFALSVAGGQVLNVGKISSGAAGTLQTHDGYPAIASVAPNGPFAPPAAPSIDFGPQLTTSGVRAVDFVDASIASALGGDELTLMGWLDLDSEASGAGGNRLISTLRRAGDRFVGFELVQEGRALRLGVNAYADQQGAPLSDENLSGSDVVDGWTFFAVTYDARGTGQVTFYFGRAGAPASLDGTRTLSAGAIRTDPGQTLSLGNFPDDPERPTGGANSRVPRGKLFGVRAFRAVLGIDEIRCQERLAR